MLKLYFFKYKKYSVSFNIITFVAFIITTAIVGITIKVIS